MTLGRHEASRPILLSPRLAAPSSGLRSSTLQPQGSGPFAKLHLQLCFPTIAPQEAPPFKRPFAASSDAFLCTSSPQQAPHLPQYVHRVWFVLICPPPGHHSSLYYLFFFKSTHFLGRGTVSRKGTKMWNTLEAFRKAEVSSLWLPSDVPCHHHLRHAQGCFPAVP